MSRHILSLIFIVINLYLVDAQWNQIGQDIIGELPNDELGNNGGHGVALSANGEIVIIGARESNVNGMDSGQVKVYEYIDATWTQVGENINGENAGDYLGASVNINAAGNIIITGARLNDTNGIDSGQVKIYENVAGVWTEIGDILGESSGDEFGYSVSINGSGSVIAVGSRLGSDNNSGHVKIYENISGNWIQIGSNISVGNLGAWFGGSVALNDSGNKIVIGSPYNDSIGNNFGLVQVYENNSGNWNQIGNDIYGNYQSDLLGYSVDINSTGDRIIASSIFNNNIDPTINSGYARVFDNINGDWIEIAVFNGEADNDIYGAEVSISGDGNRVAIGAHLYNSLEITNSGHVEIFEEQSGAWPQVYSDIYGEGFYNYTGRSIDLNEDGYFLAVATPLGDQNGNNSGHIKVYNSLPSTSFSIQYSCVGEATQFSINTTEIINSILWDFGNGNTSILENPSETYTLPGNYMVSVTLNSGTDATILSQSITISEVPMANTVSDLTICDIENTVLVDLSTKDYEILDSQSSSLYNVAYFSSYDNAVYHNSQLQIPYTNTTNNEEIFVKIFNVNDVNCYDITSFFLKINKKPIANTISDYLICEDSYDGFFIFDLDTKITEILDNQDNSLFNVTYHNSQNDADNNTNPLSNNYTNTTNPETVFVRIENINDTTCYNTTLFVLEVIDNPNINDALDFSVCDDITNDGIALFDLTEKDIEVFGNQSPSTFEVSYYENETDLLNHTNQLSFLYTNISNPQQVFVKINAIDNVSCFSYDSFNLVVNNLPIANQPNNYYICDDSNNDGLYTFNLTEFNSDILGSQSNSTYNISYHLSQNDADENLSPLGTDYTIISNPQTIYARVNNINNEECYDTTSFQIGTDYLPTAIQPTSLSSCDDDSNDGMETFDLTIKDIEILGTLSSLDYNISYYENSLDAQNGINQINETVYNNSSNPQTIYARLENNNNSNCYTTTFFDLQVYPKPDLNIQDVWILCNGNSIDLYANQAYDEYLWSTEETTSTITVNEIGNYDLTVTNVHGELLCSTTKSISVIESDAATILDIETIDWSQENNSITIEIEGIGDYEYSLDGINYQENNQFNNLNIGDYTIYVRDKNGCGVTTKNVSLLFYPNFFTPNNDGFNDHWQIFNSNSEPNNVTHIFNRYGNLIRKLSWFEVGWDGTLNGTPLPASDYWFITYRKNGKTHKGHFSLKR